MTEDPFHAVAGRLAIVDLLPRYATAVDQRDWDLYRSVFTADAEVDSTSAGGTAGPVDAVVAFLDAALSGFEMTQHLVGNVDAVVDGDEARVTAVFTNPLRLAGGDTWFTGGWYHHALVRTAAGWRSRRLREESAWFDRAPFCTPRPQRPTQRR